MADDVTQKLDKAFLDNGVWVFHAPLDFVRLGIDRYLLRGDGRWVVKYLNSPQDSLDGVRARCVAYLDGNVAVLALTEEFKHGSLRSSERFHPK